GADYPIVRKRGGQGAPACRILQGMHVRQQILNLLIVEHAPEAFHFATPVFHDVGHALIVRREPTQWHVLLLEDGLHCRALLSSRGIRLVAAVAIIVVNTTTASLLLIQPEFSIGLAPLDFTAVTDQQPNTRHKGTETQTKNLRPSFHCACLSPCDSDS